MISAIFLVCLVRYFVFKFSYRSVVKEFFNLSDTMMGYFTKVGLFGEKNDGFDRYDFLRSL